MSNLILHLKELEKEKTKPTTSKKKKHQISAEINEMETREMIEKVNETKSCFFKKINKQKCVG